MHYLPNPSIHFLIEGGICEQSTRQCYPPRVCQRLLHDFVKYIKMQSYLLPRMLNDQSSQYDTEDLMSKYRLNITQISFRNLWVHLPVAFVWLDIMIFVHSQKIPRKIWYILLLIPGCRCHELELEKEMQSLNSVSLLSDK